jgi:hypothetical protein
MADTINCATHGESPRAFVCSHLLGDTYGLGFNHNEPSADNAFPDAWCDECEIIRASHDGWNEHSQELVTISLLCSGCYERSRIRNTRTAVTLDDLADLRWKCGNCDEWHTGLCLDFTHDWPDYWRPEFEERIHRPENIPYWSESEGNTFLNEDYCAISGRDFFVRGLIQLPIIGTGETLRWGVWGSLSAANFGALLRSANEPEQAQLPSMFSWLSTQISEYPDTLNLKMHAHIQKADLRPNFELELSDHPLSREYHNGITPERVKEIMLGRLKQNE